MEENYVTKIHYTKNLIYGECNAVVPVIKKKGKMGTLDIWINPDGITNIFYIPRLEIYGYCVTYETKE